MCGITGWVDLKRSLLNETATITKMADTLSKRGPDDTNVWTQQHVAFGHKRLVVVDPQGGRQPMTREKNEQRYTLCYNGELYNTEDIRKELLKRGYQFQGHSDTEVLLTSYIELKAILAHPEVKAEVGLDGLAEVFGLGPSRSPGHGVFKEINELRPAHALTLTRNGLKIWRYWNVKSEQHTDDLGETTEKVKFLVQDAIVRQLVSDVPVCTFLSGGVDSSAITAIAANAFKESGKGSLHTYSIDYEDNDKFFKANEFQPNSDGTYIKLMSDTFQTNHHRCIISTEDLVQHLTEAVEVRGLPGMADVDSSLLWFCREIKQDFVVSLSGECADEIFGGYPWFHRKHDLSSDTFPWMRSLDARIDLLQSSWRKKLQLEDYVRARYEETLKEVPELEGESLEDAQRRKLFYLNQIWFMTTLLDRKDRMSMGASLEVRVPFADHRLVEYAWNIPWEMKMTGNKEKGILRKALEGILPHDVLFRI